MRLKVDQAGDGDACCYRPIDAREIQIAVEAQLGHRVFACDSEFTGTSQWLRVALGAFGRSVPDQRDCKSLQASNAVDGTILSD